MSKVCKRCEMCKDLDEFYNHPKHSDVKDSICKECVKKRVKDRYWKNHDEMKEYNRLAKKKHVDRDIESYRKADLARKQIPKQREWRRQYERDNKVWLKQGEIRTIRENRAKGKFTLQEFNELKNKYGNMCLSCLEHESVKPLTADHVIPLCRGGDNTISNIQPLCKSCNSSKGTKIVDYRETFTIIV